MQLVRWLRFIHAIPLGLLTVVYSYSLIAPDVLVTINLENVYISQSLGNAWVTSNVTFELTKFQIFEDQISKERLRSHCPEDPREPLCFDLSITLNGSGVSHVHTFRNVSFSREGVYRVQLLHQFRSVPLGKYSLIVRQPLHFRTGTVYWDTWTISVIFF